VKGGDLLNNGSWSWCLGALKFVVLWGNKQQRHELKFAGFTRFSKSSDTLCTCVGKSLSPHSSFVNITTSPTKHSTNFPPVVINFLFQKKQPSAHAITDGPPQICQVGLVFS
jgi:hypothetical protein